MTPAELAAADEALSMSVPPDKLGLLSDVFGEIDRLRAALQQVYDDGYSWIEEWRARGQPRDLKALSEIFVNDVQSADLLRDVLGIPSVLDRSR